MDFDSITDVAVGDDGSVLLAGDTWGYWDGTNAGRFDFAVCQLNAKGNETWRWQVSISPPKQIFLTHMTFQTCATLQPPFRNDNTRRILLTDASQG